MPDELDYWIGFSVFPGIGPLRFTKIIEYFGSARTAWDRNYEDFVGLGINPKLCREFIGFRDQFDPQAYRKFLKDRQITPLPRNHSSYPQLLANISDPPIVLFIKSAVGNRHIDMARTIAVVGTRKISDYGRQVTEKIVTGLGAINMTIVSGLAYGVDAQAHKIALESGCQTVAVLGCGVDIAAPPGNSYLYRRIIDSGLGAVISEMPPGHRPSKGLFPARNRIISGLSLGVVVIEGESDSGALITAGYAADQGREVFAVPGPITSATSRAPHILIKKGAHPVESSEDIAEILGFDTAAKSVINLSYVPADKKEELIINSLKSGPVHIDEIVRLSDLTVADISATLSVLEIKGIIKNIGNNIYQKI